MNRLVEVFCATQRHQKTKTKNKKNETQTKVRMAASVRFSRVFLYFLFAAYDPT